MPNKTTLKTFAVICFITLTSVIIWASFDKNVFLGGELILNEPWGIATFVDLYISFTLLTIVMGIVEKSWKKGLILGISTYLLGSLVPLVYIIVKMKKLESFYLRGQTEK